MHPATSTDYKALYEQAQLQIIQLQQQLNQLQKMIFGSKQERFIPIDANTKQLSLDIQAESVTACSITSAQKITYTRTNAAVEPKQLAHPGRMKLPESLRREEIIIEPRADITGCKDG